MPALTHRSDITLKCSPLTVLDAILVYTEEWPKMKCPREWVTRATDRTPKELTLYSFLVLSFPWFSSSLPFTPSSRNFLQSTLFPAFICNSNAFGFHRRFSSMGGEAMNLNIGSRYSLEKCVLYIIYYVLYITLCVGEQQGVPFSVYDRSGNTHARTPIQTCLGQFTNTCEARGRNLLCAIDQLTATNCCARLANVTILSFFWSMSITDSLQYVWISVSLSRFCVFCTKIWPQNILIAYKH